MVAILDIEKKKRKNRKRNRKKDTEKIKMDTLDDDRIEAPCVTISEDDKVLQQLKNISDWTNGVDTSLDHILYDGEKKQKAHIKLLETNEWRELGEAEKTRKRINCFSVLKDFDLSDYQDACEKFEGGITQRRDLFVFPIVLPSSDKDGNMKGKAKVPEAETIAEYFAVQQERLISAEPGRRLSLGTPSITKDPIRRSIYLEGHKVNLKVRVKAEAQGQSKKNKIKCYEKKRVIWASVMLKSTEVPKVQPENKERNTGYDNSIIMKNLGGGLENPEGVFPYNQKDWWKYPCVGEYGTGREPENPRIPGYVVNSEIDDESRVNNWKKTVLDKRSEIDWKKYEYAISNIYNIYAIKLHPTSEWVGENKNIAELTLDINEIRQSNGGGLELENHPEEFYWDSENTNVRKYRHNLYIFPIVINAAKDGLEDTCLPISANLNYKSAELQQRYTNLAKCAITSEDVVTMPEFTIKNWPTTIGVVTARFYDYANATDGANKYNVNTYFGLKIHFSAWQNRPVKIFKTGNLGLRTHNGTDIRAPGGTEIFAAAADGEIVKAGKDLDGYLGFGVVVKHENRFYIRYAHMSNTEEVTFTEQAKNHGQYKKGDTVELVYKGITLKKVNDKNPIEIPDVPQEGSIELECKNAYKLIGRTVDARAIIGHSGRNKEYKIDMDGEEVTIPPDHNMPEHLHFEIYWQSDAGMYYLNPEYYFFKNSKISFIY